MQAAEANAVNDHGAVLFLSDVEEAQGEGFWLDFLREHYRPHLEGVLGRYWVDLDQRSLQVALTQYCLDLAKVLFNLDEEFVLYALRPETTREVFFQYINEEFPLASLSTKIQMEYLQLAQARALSVKLESGRVHPLFGLVVP